MCASTVRLDPPRNLRVFNATTSSLTVKWDPAIGPVQNYRITYVPVNGGDPLTVSSQLVFKIVRTPFN